jgi:uncharacterized protein (TIGR03663 family)
MLDDKAITHPKAQLETFACIAVFIIAVLLAAWLRFHQLDIKPFHHDEGVNSHFLIKLADYGDYKYDPNNYHGPTLYYFALVATWIFGRTDFALRFTPALFGVLTVLALWLLRHRLGSISTAAAALAVALSPGLVFFSRYFIHEMSFGLFTLGIVIGMWRYAETKNFGWLSLLFSSLALLVATKETAIINLTVLILAVICAAIWDVTRRLIRARNFTLAALINGLLADGRRVMPSFDHALAAIISFVFIYVLFYSSLFTNWPGVDDFFYSIAHWTKDRSSQDHVHPFYYYSGILLKLELPLFIGSLLASVFVVWRGTRFWLFVAAWTLGTWLAYSYIPYKTPWLMVSFMIPMALLSGYAVEQIYCTLPLLSLRVLWIAVVLIVCVICGQKAWQVNFQRYDDNGNETGYLAGFGKRRQFKPYVDGQYGYVYAQTDRALLGLVETVKAETDKLPSGKHTGIHVAAPEYWPLPWYLREYDQVAYAGNLPQPLNITQPLLIANTAQRLELDLLPNWRLAGKAYTLRPGVDLFVYVRSEAVP